MPITDRNSLYLEYVKHPGYCSTIKKGKSRLKLNSQNGDTSQFWGGIKDYKYTTCERPNDTINVYSSLNAK